LAATPGPVRSTSGVEMLARGLKPSSAITTLIIAGGEGVRTAAICPKTLAFVRALAKRGVRVASVCSGAYVLAEAGLLDGRRATTHWQRTRHFVSAYPKVKLEADRIYTRDGNVWTSAGITAGIDLALAMVVEDYGDEIAQRTAKQLVLYHRRSGGQSQFSSLLELKAPTGRFGPLLAWAREHLDAPLTVEDMAEHAGMSSRHFTRAFIAETGTRQSSASRSPLAFAIPSACAAPSSAPSASRRNRCAARPGRGDLLLRRQARVAVAAGQVHAAGDNNFGASAEPVFIACRRNGYAGHDGFAETEQWRFRCRRSRGYSQPRPFRSWQWARWE
jgi:hypothetical protein